MAKHWYQSNLRFLQTVLREPDIIGYDAKAVVGYMKEARANTLVVNAGGVIDFFDNPLEMANPNRFMKSDILRGICDEIHSAGLHVITRVDFRGAEPRRQKIAPDWFSFNQDGSPRTGDLGGAVITKPCYHSYYANGHAQNYVDYIMKTYDIDGIWQNALGFDSGPCYCKNCRDAYYRETGKEIPRLAGAGNGGGYGGAAGNGNGGFSLDSPEFAEYRAWKALHADRHIESMRAAVKKYGGDKAYCAEIFDIYNTSFSLATGIDHFNAKKSFDFIISAVFIDSSHGGEIQPYDNIYGAASTIRFSRALDPKKQPVICTGGNGTRQRYVKAPALETRLWMWEIASVGGGIWNCYFNGMCPAKTHDRRNAFSEKPAYTYLAENSASISDAEPVMDAAIYYSAASKDRFCSHDAESDMFGVHIKGIERVLLENHIQYNFLPDSGLCAESLKGVKALLLPNAALMSDKEIDVIKEYVKGGGGLVATYESSLYDEKGAKRGDFGLADVFGVSDCGVRANNANDAYQLVREKESALLAGVGDTEVLANGGRTLLCRLSGKQGVVGASGGGAACESRQDAVGASGGGAACETRYNAVSTYIPLIPNQPPEYAWLPDMRTDYPIIVEGRYGKGRVVYFANCTDAQCYLDGHEDYTEIYKNAVGYASNGEYSINVDAPRSVHVNVIKDQLDDGHLIVSFVNVSGAQHRPIKEVLPVYGACASVPLNGKTLSGSKPLYGEGVKISTTADRALIEVGELNEFASVELRLI